MRITVQKCFRLLTARFTSVWRVREKRRKATDSESDPLQFWPRFSVKSTFSRRAGRLAAKWRGSSGAPGRVVASWQRSSRRRGRGVQSGEQSSRRPDEVSQKRRRSSRAPGRCSPRWRRSSGLPGKRAASWGKSFRRRGRVFQKRRGPFRRPGEGVQKWNRTVRQPGKPPARVEQAGNQKVKLSGFFLPGETAEGGVSERRPRRGWNSSVSSACFGAKAARPSRIRNRIPILPPTLTGLLGFETEASRAEPRIDSGNTRYSRRTLFGFLSASEGSIASFSSLV